MARRRRGRLSRLVALLLVAGAVAAAFVYGPTLLDRYGDRLFSNSRCTVNVDGVASTLTAEQSNNAALIAAAAIRKGLPAHAVTVAIAAAFQESDLRNIDYGDRDSLGLFQQRPSQGWGTADQILDPYYAAGQFYDHLVLIDGWEDMSVTDAAQAVQRSGHPLGYADHEADARAWARVLTGEVSPRSLSCSLPGGPPDALAETAFASRLDGDFGSAASATVEPRDDGSRAVRVTASSEQAARAAAAWSIAVASRWSVVDVTTCDGRWSRENGAWEDAADTSACDAVIVVVRSP